MSGTHPQGQWLIPSFTQAWIPIHSKPSTRNKATAHNRRMTSQIAGTKINKNKQFSYYRVIRIHMLIMSGLSLRHGSGSLFVRDLLAFSIQIALSSLLPKRSLLSGLDRGLRLSASSTLSGLLE